MRAFRIYWALVLAVSMLFGVSASDSAGILVRENFEDGDAQDGDPVTWVVLRGPTVPPVEDGSLVIAGNNIPAAIIEDLVIEDTSIRTQLRLPQGEVVGIAARRSPDGTNYIAGFDHSVGGVFLGRGDPDGSTAILDEHDGDFDVINEDFLIQLDAIGNTVSAWVWRPGEPMPKTPLLSAVDDHLPTGSVMVWAVGASGGGYSSSEFRYVYVDTKHIPEPSTLLLCVVALGACAGWRKWSR